MRKSWPFAETSNGFGLLVRTQLEETDRRLNAQISQLNRDIEDVRLAKAQADKDLKDSRAQVTAIKAQLEDAKVKQMQAQAKALNEEKLANSARAGRAKALEDKKNAEDNAQRLEKQNTELKKQDRRIF